MWAKLLKRAYSAPYMWNPIGRHSGVRGRIVSSPSGVRHRKVGARGLHRQLGDMTREKLADGLARPRQEKRRRRADAWGAIEGVGKDSAEGRLE